MMLGNSLEGQLQTVEQKLQEHIVEQKLQEHIDKFKRGMRLDAGKEKLNYEALRDTVRIIVDCMGRIENSTTKDKYEGKIVQLFLTPQVGEYSMPGFSASAYESEEEEEIVRCKQTEREREIKDAILSGMPDNDKFTDKQVGMRAITLLLNAEYIKDRINSKIQKVKKLNFDDISDEDDIDEVISEKTVNSLIDDVDEFQKIFNKVEEITKLTYLYTPKTSQEKWCVAIKSNRISLRNYAYRIIYDKYMSLSMYETAKTIVSNIGTNSNSRLCKLKNALENYITIANKWNVDDERIEESRRGNNQPEMFPSIYDEPQLGLTHVANSSSSSATSNLSFFGSSSAASFSSCSNNSNPSSSSVAAAAIGDSSSSSSSSSSLSPDKELPEGINPEDFEEDEATAVQRSIQANADEFNFSK